MLVGLTADTVPLGSEETIDRDIDAWALGLHDCPVECAYIVQVDVDREPVETEVEAVERRPALEDEPLRQERVAGDLLRQVQEPQHLFERAEWRSSRRPVTWHWCRLRDRRGGTSSVAIEKGSSRSISFTPTDSFSNPTVGRFRAETVAGSTRNR